MSNRHNDMWSRNEHACSPILFVTITMVGHLLLFSSVGSVDGREGGINARHNSTNSRATFLHVVFSLLNRSASRMTRTRNAGVEPRTAPTETEGYSGVEPMFSNPHDDTQHPSRAEYIIKSAESRFGRSGHIPRSTWWGGTRRKVIKRKEERSARGKLVKGEGGLDLNSKEKGLFLSHSNGRKRQTDTFIDLVVKGDASSGNIGNIKREGEEEHRRRGNGFQYLENMRLLEKSNIEFKVPSRPLSTEEEKTDSSDETYLEPSREINDVTKRDTFSGNINTAAIKSLQTPSEAGIQTGSSKMGSNDDTSVKNGGISSSVSGEISSPAFSINDRFRAIVTNVSFKQSHSVKNIVPPNSVMNGSIDSSPGPNGWSNRGLLTRQQSIQSTGVVRIDRNTATDNGRFPGVDTQIEAPNHSTPTQNGTFDHREAADDSIRQSGVHFSGSVSEMLDSPSSARIKPIGGVGGDLQKGLAEPTSSDSQLNTLGARGEVSLTEITPQTISHPYGNDSNKVYNTEINASPTTSTMPGAENVTSFNLSKNVVVVNETNISPPVASTDMTQINSYTNQSGHLYSNFSEGIQAVSEALFGSSSEVTPMSGWSYRGGGTSDRDVASSSDWSNISGLQVEATSEQGEALDDAGGENVTGDAVPAWPVKLAAVMEGDLILGGLMMVHEREDSVTCGPIMPQGGIQALETMLYTLDTLNSDPRLLPNVTLGAHILDDCDKDTYGLEMAVDFIKGSISNIDGAEYNCNKTQIRKVISGVVGAASSVTSIQVANLLRLFKIPQVSFFSTSPELSNKQRFEYFFRTIPSDHYQVKVMVEIIRRFGWSYVSILYEESNYGIKAFEELETLLSKHNICIAVKEKLVKDSGVAEEVAYDTIVHKLLTKPRARGAIIFGSDQEVAEVMKAVRRSNATGSFSWIGSDGWSARSLVSSGNEPEVEGTLSVQPQANPVRGFEEYFLNLTVENNRRNPWFVEFWEDHFHCRYPNSSRTPYNQKYVRLCTTKERLSRSEMAFEGQLQFVSDAVLAFAHAFRNMHQDLCHGRPGLCDVMKPIKGTELLKYLRKVDFAGLSGDKFRFDLNGDGPARYNIIHFKQNSPGKYEWVRVGEYLEGELTLNMSEIQFKLGHRQLPESVCSLPCDQGQAKKYVEGESCCWHCFNCTQYQVRHPLDETQCVVCPQGTLPDTTRVRCQEIPEVFLRPESGWAIGAMSLSATGILVTLFVAGVFVRHNDTPVVRASGRELSYVLLTGILLCYCVTFALVLRPTDVVCGVQRFGAGFCFTVVYAALLTKTNRIARIFNAGKRTAKRPSFISPRSQLFICITLIGIQVLINGVWILVSPPRAVHHYPTRDDNHLVCSSHIDASYMIAFGYPIFLIIVCTVYAVLTRKIPEAFNESKHIGFTMYTTCVIWLAFVPLYFGTGNHVPLRITSMSVTISMSASVTLTCLFSPKLYIILVHPERNVRQSMMPMRYSAIKSPAVTGTTQTGSMMAAAVVCNQTRSYTIQQIHASSQGVDSGTQSDGAELDRQRKSESLLVHQETQTDDCGEAQDLPRSSDSHPVDVQSKTCHIINSSSNGPMSIPAPHKSRDVQL